MAAAPQRSRVRGLAQAEGFAYKNVGGRTDEVRARPAGDSGDERRDRDPGSDTGVPARGHRRGGAADGSCWRRPADGAASRGASRELPWLRTGVAHPRGSGCLEVRLVVHG